ncbi:hypothetical protein ES288_D07G144600v1 [Gossypium darwinii]|uniref:Uncharacterized protein n=1 Tax=Gossypium darwinii TaxID=34276 RepID=A0A5D2BZV5_GOSDA|nr:hypothetical protein ES288_D07G144600v1 [Gossypium darwinii]
MQLEPKARTGKETSLVDNGTREEAQAALASSTLQSEGKLVTDVTAAKVHIEVQGGQIVKDTHGAQPIAISGPQTSHRFNVRNLLEVAVTPSKGILDPTKHSVVVFKELGNSGGK